MSFPKPTWNQASFFRKYRIDPKRFSACGVKWEELSAIAKDHCEKQTVLLPVAHHVSERLRILPDVHSLRVRIKDPEHLIEKIIREVSERKRPITVENYQDEITDLIGIRALHLFKDQWKPIHDFLTKNWNTHGRPTAYLRQGDSEKLAELLNESGCNVQYHDFGYRSVHYLLKVEAGQHLRIIELQVRTVFEEGWSEIDHLIRYPNHSKDQRLEEFLVLFNTLAGNADEMGSFIKNLSCSLHHDAVRIKETKQQLKDKKKDLQKSEETLKKAVARLNNSQREKTDLETRINELTAKRMQK